MKFTEQIAAYRPLIEAYLASYFDAELARENTQPLYRDAIAKLKLFATKGKLIRGTLVLLTYSLCGGKEQESIVSLAAAIELTQSALLIHDDIMDNDEIRRGEKTIYAQYSDMGKNQNVADPQAYGQALAICAGDIAFFLAYDSLVKSPHDTRTLQRLVQQFSHEMLYVGAAQMHDLDYGQTGKEPSLEEIIAIYRHKTARYTFSLPFALGAIAAQAPEAVIDGLITLGEDLGIVFQIQDDQLGLLGEAHDIGKPVGSDIRENKKTVFRALLFSQADAADKAFLADTFGNQTISADDLTRVRGLLAKLKVIEQVAEITATYNSKVQTTLASLPVHPDQKAALQALITYNTARAR